MCICNCLNSSVNIFTENCSTDSEIVSALLILPCRVSEWHGRAEKTESNWTKIKYWTIWISVGTAVSKQVLDIHFLDFLEVFHLTESIYRPHLKTNLAFLMQKYWQVCSLQSVHLSSPACWSHFIPSSAWVHVPHVPCLFERGRLFSGTWPWSSVTLEAK